MASDTNYLSISKIVLAYCLEGEDGPVRVVQVKVQKCNSINTYESLFFKVSVELPLIGLLYFTLH